MSKMKVVVFTVLLCIIEISFVLASPISEKGATAANMDLPVNKGSIQNLDIGYIPTPNIGTHKYHGSQKKNWNDARTTCLNEGGHLAVINSAAEEALLVKNINVTGDFGADQLWIGVHEQFKKDDWVSVRDERLDAIRYVHWSSGQPDNANNNEHCLGITPSGMNDMPCETELFFVCEII